MSEILEKELKNNIGKEVLIFLKNNFRYTGKILDCDSSNVKLDDRISGMIIISLDSISSVKGGSKDDK